jgi:hypothetical protein
MTKLPQWKPSSLRAPFLIAVILASSALIIVLQLLLWRSQSTGGILFAPNVNNLPLSTTFPFLYLPTILSVFYGFLWAWIDLDIRRLEPYFQLSKRDGATGRESLLLHYPVDFLASVPIKALKFRSVNNLTLRSQPSLTILDTGRFFQLPVRLLLSSETRRYLSYDQPVIRP